MVMKPKLLSGSAALPHPVTAAKILGDTSRAVLSPACVSETPCRFKPVLPPYVLFGDESVTEIILVIKLFLIAVDGSQNLIWGQRQYRKTGVQRVIDSIRRSWGCRDCCHLAYAFCAEGSELFSIFDQENSNGWHVHAVYHVVSAELVAPGYSGFRMKINILTQCEAESHLDSAMDLAFHDSMIDRLPDVLNGNDIEQFDEASQGIHFEFHEVYGI